MFQKRAKQIVNAVEIMAAAAKDVFVALISLISLIAAPLAPATTFGFALYDYARTELDPTPAAIAGVALALTLEGAGIVSAHVTLQAYRARAGRAKVVLGLVIMFLYLAFGVAAVWLFEEDIRFRVMGTLAFLVATLVYGAHALLYDARVEEEQEAAAAEETRQEREREWQVELEQLRTEREAAARREAHQLSMEEEAQRQAHEARMRQIELKAEVEMERARASTAVASAASSASTSKAEPAPSEHTCEYCQQSFGTVQALNAHSRWCKAKDVNGSK